MRRKKPEGDVAPYAETLTPPNSEARLRIIRLLLSAHPDGMGVGDIRKELGITASTLSDHLEKLKNHDLVAVRRDAVVHIKNGWRDCFKRVPDLQNAGR